MDWIFELPMIRWKELQLDRSDGFLHVSCAFTEPCHVEPGAPDMIATKANQNSWILNWLWFIMFCQQVLWLSTFDTSGLLVASCHRDSALQLAVSQWRRPRLLALLCQGGGKNWRFQRFRVTICESYKIWSPYGLRFVTDISVTT